MCFFKSVNLDTVPSTLTAHISADSKYWLYINGQTVVFEGSLKRDSGRGYYDSVDIAPYLKEGAPRRLQHHQLQRGYAER